MQKHVKSLDINVNMDSDIVWSCHLNCEADVSHSFNRAREVLENRLTPFAYNPDPPSDMVFADMFAFFRALAGIKSISPLPDMTSSETRVELLQEAECWLSLWETLLSTTSEYGGQKCTKECAL